MALLLHEVLQRSADTRPDAAAVSFKSVEHTYESLWSDVQSAAAGFVAAGLEPLTRVALYLPKTPRTVAAIFGASLAGSVFVPINPLLKPQQVAHILRDCGARVLVTSADRAGDLTEVLPQCAELEAVVLTDDQHESGPRLDHVRRIGWDDFARPAAVARAARTIDADAAAILYTSGSTGLPKGVVLSHRNMVTGASSVAQYLGNVPEDRLLAVLPFSFDYGFSQLTTAFTVGAAVVLMDYLFPRDVLTMTARERITGLAGVPPLWAQLAELQWPETVTDHLRYLTNSGGAMPRPTLDRLRRALPSTRVFLMYGLTEAFRSTFLPPEEIDRRPDSIGKAIPNAEVMVVRPDGTPCADDEPGELVHRGALVALGYWNDPERTAERFRPAPGRLAGLPLPETAVWSGDTVRRDEAGYLYFVGRHDEMIKTSGYRVSPTEIEEVLSATGLVAEAVALGVPHPTLGQVIAVVVTPAAAAPGYRERQPAGTDDAATQALLDECRRRLPAFMVPMHVEWRDAMPRNANGKYDRKHLAAELAARDAGVG